MDTEDASADTTEEPDQKRGDGNPRKGATARRQTIQCREDEPRERPGKQQEEQYGAGDACHWEWVMKRIEVPGIQEGIRDRQYVEHREAGGFQK